MKAQLQELIGIIKARDDIQVHQGIREEVETANRFENSSSVALFSNLPAIQRDVPRPYVKVTPQEGPSSQQWHSCQ
ncbi:hypothetical protein O0I10_005397 [Lichtheimia ornata]|uniref:Uncharacterized protein n=1 Tax=Lichtheimia ornata TaxID=688661 RepID=A0AAD7XYD3_9FUNG|nr:uncharacterized protein O0I10_005397 [Lichtheimia ornata]KAJ8659015.1 hypothetical protein O0I10_005397 [Lichtheimia ornata]